MRMIPGVTALAVLSAAPAFAQGPYYAPPRGSYERQCTDIRMEGQFLSAYCRGARGSGRSSINVLSCSTDIFVDENGGLACVGPGGGAPPSVREAPPGFATPRDYETYRDRGDYGGFRGRRGYGGVTIYMGAGWRGPSLRLDGPTPDLHGSDLNDRVRSIRLDRRAGPWLVCTNANYGGRCVTIERSVPDTRRLGISESISSLRPAW